MYFDGAVTVACVPCWKSPYGDINGTVFGAGSFSEVPKRFNAVKEGELWVSCTAEDATNHLAKRESASSAFDIHSTLTSLTTRTAPDGYDLSICPSGNGPVGAIQVSIEVVQPSCLRHT